MARIEDFDPGKMHELGPIPAGGKIAWPFFKVVEVDGVLADVGALVHFMSVLQPEGWKDGFTHPGAHTPPVTLGKLADGYGFTHLDELVDAIRSHENFWEHAPTPIYHELPDTIDPSRTIFHVVRMVTRGDPVLEQTIRWLRKYYEIPSPIVWWEEEEL